MLRAPRAGRRLLRPRRHRRPRVVGSFARNRRRRRRRALERTTYEQVRELRRPDRGHRGQEHDRPWVHRGRRDEFW